MLNLEDIAAILDHKSFLYLFVTHNNASHDNYRIDAKITIFTTDKELFDSLFYHFPYASKTVLRKPSYIGFCLSNRKKMIMFLETILPYLDRNKEKATIFLEFCKYRLKLKNVKHTIKDKEFIIKFKQANVKLREGEYLGF